MENHETSNSGQFSQPVNRGSSPYIMKQELPNSTAVLVLGIISIFGCFCWGIVGLVLGIIALVLAGKANNLYLQNPENYSESSLNNFKAGKVCAIVGTCLSALFFIMMLIYIVFIASFIAALPWNNI